MCITEIKMPRNEDELLKPSTREQIVNNMHFSIRGWELNSQQATSYKRDHEV